MPGSSYKASRLTSGPVNGSCRRHNYVTQNWVLLSAKKPDDPYLPLQYKVRKARLKSFAPLYGEKSEKVQDVKKHQTKPIHRSTLPKIITRDELRSPFLQESEEKVVVKNTKLPGSVGSLQALTKKWESGTERYHSWKLRRSVVCEEVKPEELATDEEASDPIVPESVCDEDLQNDSKIEGPPSVVCKLRWSVAKPDEVQDLFDHQMPKAMGLSSLLDSQHHFPEESISSDEDAEIKKRDADKEMGLVEIPEIHQRKYRRLRRATRDLVAWIESLKPERSLNFHLVTNLDGTQTNIPMKPYVPYPEDEQPYPLIDENEVAEMVKNSYGSRPAMTLRVAVRDMDHLPEELEKFDNVHYLKRKVIEDSIYRKSKKISDERYDKEAKPITRYSFGFAPVKPKNRRISAVGTVFDAVTGRRCRYGAWYLKQELWRKMDATEDIKQEDVEDSDEEFERVTGQKRIHAEEANYMPTALKATAADVSHLHTAKEFYKLLKSRGRPIPPWLQSCEQALLQIEIEEAGKTAPFGSEVWQAAREAKNVLNACHRPHSPLESLLRTDMYCREDINRKSTGQGSEQPLPLSGLLETKLDPDCYAFLDELERGVARKSS